MFIQGGKVRDYIFPILASTADADYVKYHATGFMIGNQGFAVTARHVVEKISRNEYLASAFFANNDCSWSRVPIVAHESCPNADMAVVKLMGDNWKSPYRFIDSTPIFASLPYSSFGYPADSSYDNLYNGKAIIRPDMTYTCGYIRRRIGDGVDSIRGKFLFELSDVGGQGYSGAPVLLKNSARDVIGVYSTEKTNDGGVMVAYGGMTQDFIAWVPSILDRSIFEEAEQGYASFSSELFNPNL